MQIYGLCGGSGSGKSTVAAIFASAGIRVLDADKIYSELLYPSSPLINEIAQAFGNSVISEDGNLNRKALAKLVFSEDGRTALLPTLNRITHKAVICETLSRIESLSENGCKAVVFDAPLLYESGFDKRCDKIIGVIADREIRLSRIMKRDNISHDAAVARIDSQMSDSFIKTNADFIIVNNGTAEELAKNVLAVAEKIFSEE